MRRYRTSLSPDKAGTTLNRIVWFLRFSTTDSSRTGNRRLGIATLAVLVSLVVVIPSTFAVDHADAPTVDAIEHAKESFRAQGSNRVKEAKILYPLIKLGMTTSEVVNILGVPDRNKGGQARFFDYSIAKGQEIEIEFDSPSGKVVRKHEVGLGLDPPPSAPPPIPENLLPYVKDYTAPETTLRAGFIPYKARLVWGEPLEVTFTVDDLGPKDFEFMFGGDYRSTGRHNRFKIEVTDAAGKLLPDPHANAPDFGGLLSHEILTPGGRNFTKTIDLTKFRTIDKPGEYTVTCSFAFDEPYMAKKEPAKPVVNSSFHIAILERTPERVAQILDELVTKAESASEANKENLAGAMTLIAQFGQEDAVPRLVQLAHKGSVPRRAAAFAALALVPSDVSLDAALAGLKDTDPAIRIAAARALGAMQKPRGVDALLGALANEKSPVTNEILVALGTSKSARALPVLVGTLEGGAPELKSAAVTALVSFGGPEAISALMKYVDTKDLSLRYEVVLALAEKLHQPMETEWLFPVLMRRDLGHEWLDSLRLMRMYGGEQAIPTLLSCLDYDVAWSYRNWWILNEVKACPNAPEIDYAYDPNYEGTSEQREKNLRTLQELKNLSGPIPAAPPLLKKERLPYLETDPPIDFKPTLKPVQGAVEIHSGFFRITISRNSGAMSYTPSESYRPIYQLEEKLRALPEQPDRLKALGITSAQAEQLRQLSLPPPGPIDSGSTLLYILYKESPPGPLQEQAEDDLCDAIRVASQNYHAVVTAFVQAAEKILTNAQLEHLSGVSERR
jgi:hypothetical protein